MTKNLKGLMNALRQSINEAILESDDVAAAMAALKLSGKCPVFTVDIALEDAPAPAADPGVARGLSEELVLDDLDVTFLAAMGIVDPSWCSTPEPARRGVE
jgi:hypothetical protein